MQIMRAVIVAGVLAKEDKDSGSSDIATLAVAPEHERKANAALAAASLHKTRIVPLGQPSSAVFLTVPGPVSGTHRAVSVAYRGNFLKALYPGATVTVGSLAYLVPEVDWVADPGGMVLEFPNTKPEPKEKTPSPWTLEKPREARGLGGNVTLKVSSLPKRPVTIEGPVQTVILDEAKLRGVTLKDGDIVIDSLDRRWFVYEGQLWSHKTVSFPAQDATIEGDVVRPLRSGEPLTYLTTKAVVDDNLQLQLGDKVLYGVLTTADEYGWTIKFKQTPHIVQDPMATCFGFPEVMTALDCVQRGGIWDKPCSFDSDCPYHDIFRGRGGCIDGICEMPLGVGNRSFRMPDSTPPLDLLGRRVV